MLWNHEAQYEFFRERRPISPRFPAGKIGGFVAQDYPNANAVIAVIISERFATLTELKTSIDVEEALELYEIALYNRANEARAQDAANKVK